MIVFKVTKDIVSPKEQYLAEYGKHFNEKLCDWAVNNMLRNGDPLYITKTELDDLIAKYSILIQNNKLYDYVYLANMGRFDHWGSAIVDDRHLLLFVKDILDDYDAEEGQPFCRFCADMQNKGIEIDWEDML